MSRKFDHGVGSFVCFNYPATFSNGTIKLPTTILARFGTTLPNRVYVELPNGALWRGLYDRTRNCIRDLDNMFKYYDLKPYYFMVLFYNGGHKFYLELFNIYGVELLYNVLGDRYTEIATKQVEAVWLNDSYCLSSDIVLDKLCGQFSYNCNKNSGLSSDVVISINHLQPKIYNQILSHESCIRLGLVDSVGEVEIGFKKLMWKIDLTWINNDVYFDNKWCDFAKEGKLVVGDICVFQKTEIPNKFEVAVLEKANYGAFNNSGVDQGKSLMKWMQVVNTKNILMGEMEYGQLLLEKVHLCMPEGKEIPVIFALELGKFVAVHDLMIKYSVKENYVIFFDYVGRSHFLVSIYNEKGEDVFAYLPRKVMLENIMQENDCPITDLTDLSLNVLTSCGDHLTVLGNVHNGGTRTCFTIDLNARNMIMNGVAVYIGSKLLDLFGKWTTGTDVTFICGEISCLLQVDRRVDILCIENGWENFMEKTTSSPGRH